MSGRRLIGRDDDVAATAAALTRHRLVTLTGPAGIGKSALADAVAGASDGTIMRLALPPMATDVRRALAETIGIESDDSDDLALALHDASLLVIHGAEHELADVAAMATELLVALSNLRILTTSRIPLGIKGESALPTRRQLLPSWRRRDRCRHPRAGDRIRAHQLG